MQIKSVKPIPATPIFLPVWLLVAVALQLAGPIEWHQGVRGYTEY